MKAEIIAVGSELLLGESVDTNSVWLSQRLGELGIDCYYHSTIGDNLDRLSQQITESIERSDVVILGGGLGPTQDDLTRDAIAKALDIELHRDEEVVEAIASKFAVRNRPMSESNLTQAYVPAGGEALLPMPGTAPGLWCPHPGGVVVAMPGVPYELKEIFDSSIAPRLLEMIDEPTVLKSRAIKTWGMSESALAEVLAPTVQRLDTDFENDTKATLAYLAGGTKGIKLRITVKASTKELADARIVREEKNILETLSADLVFGFDEDTIESVVLNLLTDLNLSLGVAESMTGGRIGVQLTRQPGSSKSFRGSIVSYATDVKTELLGVTSDSVVSAEAAEEMAKGAMVALSADIGLSITGVAGPDTQEGVAVGTVFFGFASKDKTMSHKVIFGSNREQTQQLATIGALNDLRKWLLSGDYR